MISRSKWRPLNSSSKHNVMGSSDPEGGDCAPLQPSAPARPNLGMIAFGHIFAIIVMDFQLAGPALDYPDICWVKKRMEGVNR